MVIPTQIIFENAIRLSREDSIKMPVAGRIAAFSSVLGGVPGAQGAIGSLTSWNETTE